MIACFQVMQPRLNEELAAEVREIKQSQPSNLSASDFMRLRRSPVIQLDPRWIYDVFPPSRDEVAAEDRARETLLKTLSPHQRAQFEKSAHFDVEVREDGRYRGTYRIHKGTVFNVEHRESGTRYCARPDGQMPVYDVMLGQKLTLETNPKEFFKQANVSPRDANALRDMAITGQMVAESPRITMDHINRMFRTFDI